MMKTCFVEFCASTTFSCFFVVKEVTGKRSNIIPPDLTMHSCEIRAKGSAAECDKCIYPAIGIETLH